MWMEPEIQKKMVVSTVHYDYRDEPRLRELAGEELDCGFTVEATDYGFEITLVSTNVRRDMKTLHQLVLELDLQHPHGIYMCLCMAFIEHGCDSMRIDGDGPTLPQFPTYDESWGLGEDGQEMNSSPAGAAEEIQPALYTAVLRSYRVDGTFEEQSIEVDRRYQPHLGPYCPENEDYCPVVGSNQEIIVGEDFE